MSVDSVCVYSGSEKYNLFANPDLQQKTEFYLDPQDVVKVYEQQGEAIYVHWQDTNSPNVKGWGARSMFTGECKVEVSAPPPTGNGASAPNHDPLPVIKLNFISSNEHPDPFSPNGNYYGPGGNKPVPSGIGNCNFAANYFGNDTAQAEFSIAKSGQVQLSRRILMDISGGCSRVNALKGMTIATDDGQDKFTNIGSIFFPHRSADTKFEELYLRAGGNDFTKSIIRDGALQSILLDHASAYPWLNDLDLQDFQPAVLYVNDRYWGLINIREKLNHKYVNYRHGVKRDNLSLAEIEYGKVAIKGSKKDPNIPAQAFQQLGSGSNLSGGSARAYAAIETFVANDDWPGNNVRLWKDISNANGWRFIVNDLDLSFGFSGEAWKRDYPDYLNKWVPSYFNGQDGWLHDDARKINRLLRQAICDNKDDFRNKIADLKNSIFSPNAINAAIAKYENLYSKEIAKHIDIWKGPTNNPVAPILGSPVNWSVPSVQDWQNHLQNMRNFINVRGNAVEGQLSGFFSALGC
jgi:hypothetical protein